MIPTLRAATVLSFGFYISGCASTPDGLAPIESAGTQALPSIRLSGSNNVINSPNTLETLARFISSMIST